MSCADLHVHSEYSKHPSEWFLQRLGAQESYTRIEDIYSIAKNLGMQFVTLTDHNTIDGALKLANRYPDDTFISVEATTYFPENECKIHLLIYDITEEQFQKIENLRSNIYTLRNYIKENDLAHSVAHATYSINGKLNLEILEKLILLFDVFEGVNGARNPYYNKIWRDVLLSLTPSAIEELYNKHAIEPYSKTPWIKGLTGGSDDHAGLFIGRTITSSESCTKRDFIESIKRKRTMGLGRANDYKSFAFTLYKIAYDFSKQKTRTRGKDIFDFINGLMFEDKNASIKNWIAKTKIKNKKKDADKIIARFVNDLIDGFSSRSKLSVDEKIDCIYGNIAQLIDDFFKMLLESFNKDLRNGNAAKMLRTLFASLPALFLSAPFFTTLRHLHLERQLITDVRQKYLRESESYANKCLWFTDTILDLNGVSVTLGNIAKQAEKLNRNIYLVFASPDSTREHEALPHSINLESVCSITPPFYDSYVMHFPSLLRSLERIYKEQPDEIIISTPGPVGILGLIAARLLGIRCKGVYHTDFTKHTEYVVGDDRLSAMAEVYTKWFYSLCDEILVPTQQYMNVLENRGFTKDRMRLFKRGIDTNTFRYFGEDLTQITQAKNMDNEFTLLWAGRVCHDKNIMFMVDLYESLMQEGKRIDLVIIGDGPQMKEVTERLGKFDTVHFIGQIERKKMPQYYSAADLFIFPSVFDTYGMVILEAQACGLPAIVSDVGGPQEIIDNKKTGFVLPANNKAIWKETILRMYAIKVKKPVLYSRLRKTIRKRIEKKYSWESALDDILGCHSEEKKGKQMQPQPIITPRHKGAYFISA